jgi:cyclopropane fatty-acyl-phospholipid synthase-like methyltransferase
MKYDKDYFENGIQTGVSGYENYRWLPERTYKEIRTIINLLDINPESSVLDFGCAKGFYVKALTHYGINAWGVDISDYAIENADYEIKHRISKSETLVHYDYIIARNVMEHIDEKDLYGLLCHFKEITNKVFFTVPLCKKNGGEYILPIPFDETHVIKWTKQKWIDE